MGENGGGGGKGWHWTNNLNQFMGEPSITTYFTFVSKPYPWHFSSWDYEKDTISIPPVILGLPNSEDAFVWKYDSLDK